MLPHYVSLTIKTIKRIPRNSGKYQNIKTYTKRVGKKTIIFKKKIHKNDKKKATITSVMYIYMKINSEFCFRNIQS